MARGSGTSRGRGDRRGRIPYAVRSTQGTALVGSGPDVARRSLVRGACHRAQLARASRVCRLVRRTSVRYTRPMTELLEGTVEVRTGSDGHPAAIRTAQGWARVVEVVNTWRVETDWWRVAVGRDYVRCLIADGDC